MAGEWTLVPKKGIEQGPLKIVFEMSRSEVRDLLKAEFGDLESNFDDEDDFHHPHDGTFLRIRYANSIVQDIEFLEGSLSYEGVKLSGGVSWPEVERGLAALGNKFRETEWLGDGYDCLPLAVNIATHEQIGGDGGGIEWGIMSSMFED